MKKKNRNKQYKRWKENRSRKIARKKGKRKKIRFVPSKYKFPPFLEKEEFVYRAPVEAPSDLCLLINTSTCVKFFNKLRSKENINKNGRLYFVRMSLSKVEKFDYSTICVLIALINDLKSQDIYIRGNFPENIECKSKIIESGLLDVLYDSQGRPFKKSQKSDLLFIEKGSKKLTRDDNIRISEAVKNVVEYLTGNREHCKSLRTILLEICGNSIEWAGTKNRQWLIGIRYDESRVIFTITDVGKGILSTLNKKFKHKLKDTFTRKPDDEILKGAFVRKYGSSTRQINRNKGLPAIKAGYDNGLLKNLKVLTNSVILHYDMLPDSQRIDRKEEFNGTFYRWIITKESLVN